MLYPFVFEADNHGEPLSLPSTFYSEERSPSGWSLLGWRLTEEGMAHHGKIAHESESI